jgi:hypothetical protein
MKQKKQKVNENVQIELGELQWDFIVFGSDKRRRILESMLNAVFGEMVFFQSLRRSSFCVVHVTNILNRINLRIEEREGFQRRQKEQRCSNLIMKKMKKRRRRKERSKDCSSVCLKLVRCEPAHDDDRTHKHLVSKRHSDNNNIFVQTNSYQSDAGAQKEQADLQDVQGNQTTNDG